MSEKQAHLGTCFCGAVQFELTGQPVAAGYCHCESCRHWSAGPLNAFTLWKPEALRTLRGSDRIASFQKTPKSVRKWCTNCGGHLFTEHPGLGVVDVYAALLPELVFEPAVHVNYEEAVLRVPDGRPKFKDMPKEMGGSGAMLPD